MSAVMAKLGAEALKWGVNQYNLDNQTGFKDSALGQYYAKKKTQGMLGDYNVRNMANQYGKFINRGKDDSLSTYQGVLSNKLNNANSIAGIRGVNEINDKANTAIADYGAKLKQENELSKNKYAEKYAEGITADAKAREEAKQQNLSNLVSGASSAVVDHFTPSDPTLASITEGIDPKDKDADIQPIIDYMMEKGKSPEEIENYLRLSGFLQ